MGQAGQPIRTDVEPLFVLVGAPCGWWLVVTGCLGEAHVMLPCSLSQSAGVGNLLTSRLQLLRASGPWEVSATPAESTNRIVGNLGGGWNDRISDSET